MKASEMLRQKYDTAREERAAFHEKINERILGGGDPASDDEKRTLAEMAERVDSRKEDYEAQRDLEQMVTDDAEYSQRASEEAAKITERSDEETESFRRAARDIDGAEGLRAYDERSGEQLKQFALLSATGDKEHKLTLAPFLSHNMRSLRELGVSAVDYVAALRSGYAMIAERNEDGRPDVRLYNVTTSGEGKELVPTFWDNSLYLYASWIGGVQNSGADVIPLTGNNVLKLPKVTGYNADGLAPGAEGATTTQEVKDTTGTTDLTPRPYRGFSAETDELMRAATIDTRLQLVLRGLSRALQLGKENDFPTPGPVAGEPKGILNGVAAGRIEKTGGNTTLPRYQDLPNALGKLDAEYHMAGRPGSLVSLMHSAIWFAAYVGSVATDGHPVYPHLAQGMKEIFTTRVEFSHAMKNAAADGNLLVAAGNFMDAYVIGTLGTAERSRCRMISVSWISSASIASRSTATATSETPTRWPLWASDDLVP